MRAGLSLYATALLLLGSGIVLTRFGFFEVNDPGIRAAAYWLHLLTPFLAAWLFVLHRLAGSRIRWRIGLRWAALALIFAGGMLGLFLLGMISKSARKPAALTGVLTGLAVIVWMTLSPRLPETSLLRSPFHANMIIVVGTLTIFLVGILTSNRGGQASLSKASPRKEA